MPKEPVQVLVTGASGFIGGALCQVLDANPRYQVTALGRQRRPRTHLPTEVRYQMQDLANAIELPASPSIVIHAAGLASDNATPKELYKDNQQATLNLIQAVSGICQHFLYLSSASVYTAQTTEAIVEEMAGRGPLSAYGQSKFDTENILIHAALEARIPLTILRPRAVYGPGDRHLLPRLRRLVKGKYLFLPGGMEFQTSLTSMDTLGQAVLAALQSPPSPLKPQVINVADQHPQVLAHAIRQALEADLRRQVIPVVVPLWPFRWLASLHPKGPTTHQALDYLSKPCVLDTSRLQCLIKESKAHGG